MTSSSASNTQVYTLSNYIYELNPVHLAYWPIDVHRGYAVYGLTNLQAAIPERKPKKWPDQLTPGRTINNESNAPP